jgi:hypothetical protein
MQLLGGLLLDHFVLAVRFPEANAIVERSATEGSPDVVILGSSRFRGIDVDEIARFLPGDGSPRRILNASVAAGDPIAADFVFERLLEQGQGATPRRILIEVSPDTLNHRDYWLRYHLQRQITWAELPAYLSDAWAMREIGTLFLSRTVPLYYFRGKIADEVARRWSDESVARPERLPKGVRRATAHVNWDELLCVEPRPLTPRQLALFRAGVDHPRRMLADYQTGGNAGAALERVLQRCAARGIQVVLVGAPVTSWYRSTYTPEINAAYHACVTELCRAHGCDFFDYGARVPDYLFVDVHHLSAEGAVYFSRLLARELLCEARSD